MVKLKSLKNYKNGNLHGKYQTFYSDGKLNSEYNLVDGRKVGDYKRILYLMEY